MVLHKLQMLSAFDKIRLYHTVIPIGNEGFFGAPHHIGGADSIFICVQGFTPIDCNLRVWGGLLLGEFVHSMPEGFNDI